MIAKRMGHTSIIPLLTQFQLVHRALAGGSKPWNRSKVMIVGEGRVGKTALCNSMTGKPFEETESTVGLTQLTCDVQRAAATNDRRWTEHTKPEREFEAGVAQLVRNTELNNPLGQEPSQQTSNNDSDKFLSLQNDIPSEDMDMNGVQCNPDSNITLESVNESTRFSNETSNAESTNETFAIDNSAPPLNSDVSLVMKYLAEVKLHNADLILSLFDFGGQSVFNIIHHLFLTSYGIYVAVFNMVSMLDHDKRESSLNELSFWIKSICVHTLNMVNRKMAPVFFVGTHKDKVKDPAKHKEISDMIRERFGHHMSWASIVENNDLCFFPVNNRFSKPKSIIKSLKKALFNRSQQDDVILNLLDRIESVVKQADYVKEPRPLTWLKALDELLATKKSFLSITAVSSIAIASGVEQGSLSVFLTFLNEMGVVLWLDEEGLRDVVILDIINFFVEPATLIICNHISKPSDSTIHHKEVQKVCRKYRSTEWNEMTQRGLVNQSLMEFLLSHKVESSNIPIIINMMLKYGLIVKLERGLDNICKGDLLPTQPPPTYYLVPALLPATVGDPTRFQDDVWRNIRKFNSCYYLFTADAMFRTSKQYSITTLQREGFLPRGLMERLICKAVKWSQLTNLTNINDITRLYQNYAAMSFGRQQFRLVCIPEINCIRLDIEGENPLPVNHRICEQIDVCIKECMGSLQFVTALRYGTASEIEDGFTLLNLVSVREVHVTGLELTVRDHPSITPQYVRSNYDAWIVSTSMLSSYDVFISHRWHKEDDEVVKQLYDAFLGHVLGSEKRAVKVFYDKVRLKMCQQFQIAFGKALKESTIVVPILCTTALEKMLTHDERCEDNVLIEWILALECIQDPIHSKVRGIYPMMFGERKGDGSVGDLFAEGVIDRLPETIPTASIKVVRRLLVENGVNVSSTLTSYSVRSIVKEVCKYLGLEGWKYPSWFSSVAAEDIVMRLEDYLNQIHNNTGSISLPRYPMSFAQCL